MSSATKKKSLRPGWMGISLLAVLLGGALTLGSTWSTATTWLTNRLRSPSLRLASVEFLGLHTLDAHTLLRTSGLVAGIPLIDLDVEKVAARVCSHPRIARCSVARIVPDHLVFEIEERVPVAHLQKTDQGIDLEGIRFPLSPHENDSLIELTGDPQPALPLLRAAASMGVRLASIAVGAPDDIRFRPTEYGFEIRVGTNPRRALAGWLRLQQSDVLRMYAARRIDLRFHGDAVLSDFRKIRGGRTNGSK